MKKGFTLIELLSVIVILAIIALIATPIVLSIIEKARMEAFKDSTYGIIKAAEYSYANAYIDGNSKDELYAFENGIQYSHTGGEPLLIKGKTPEFGIIKVSKTGDSEAVFYDGTYCSRKSLLSDEVEVVKSEDYECVLSLKSYMENSYINEAIAVSTPGVLENIEDLISKPVVDPVTGNPCQKAFIDTTDQAVVICDYFATIDTTNLISDYPTYTSSKFSSITFGDVTNLTTTSDVSLGNYSYVMTGSLITSDTDIYYYSVDVNGDGYSNVKIGNTPGMFITSSDGKYVKLSARSAKSNQTVFTLYFRTPSTEYNFKNSYAINLSLEYGIGNEPDIDRLNRLVNMSID